MIRATVAFGGIAMAWQEYFGIQLPCTNDRSVEVVNFEPEKQAVAVGLVERIR